MSAIVTLTIVLIILAGVCLTLILLHQRTLQQHAGSMLNRFNKLAAENNLRISVTEALKNLAFGIDPEQRKLLILQGTADTGQQTSLLDLTTVKNCRKIKNWQVVRQDTSDKTRPEKHLEKIALHFEFHEAHAPAELILYEYRYNSLFQMHELEQKADYWELLINQRLYEQSRETIKNPVKAT